jgi:hypothetical protein
VEVHLGDSRGDVRAHGCESGSDGEHRHTGQGDVFRPGHDSPTCIINFNIKGTQAVAAPGQTCTIDVATVGALVVTVDSWTLDTSDGMTMTGSMMGKTTIPVGGFMLTCNVTGTGELMKQP